MKTYPNLLNWIAVATLLVFNVHSANAQSDRCISSLIQDTSSTTATTATAFAMSDLVASMTSSEDKQNASLSIPIKGMPSLELGTDRARKLTTEYTRQTKYKWNQATKIEAVSSTLSDNAVAAYRMCVDGQHTSGPRIFVYDATPSQVAVKIVWLAPVGADTLGHGDVSITGGKPKKPLPSSWQTGSSFITVVDREAKQDLRVVANIGGMSDTVTVPHIPLVEVRRVTEEIIQPSPPSFHRLANDGSGRNQGPRSECYPAPSDGEIRQGSASVAVLARAGNIDSTTYAKITTQETNSEQVCWEAFLRPLSRSGGGDLQFRIHYLVDRWKFEEI